MCMMFVCSFTKNIQLFNNKMKLITTICIHKFCPPLTTNYVTLMKNNISCMFQNKNFFERKMCVMTT